MPVWAFDEYWGSGARGTAAQVRAYVNYAQGGLGNAKAVADCAGSTCKSVFYFDPHFFYDTAACGLSGDAKSIAAEASESWFVHLKGYADSAHRAHGTYSKTCNGRSTTSPVYAMNTLSTGVKNFYSAYMKANAGSFNYFFMDDTSGKVMTQFYGPGGGFCAGKICSITQEMQTDASVAEEHAALANALKHPNGTAMQGVFNGLNFTSGQPNDLSILRDSTNFFGAVCEGCVVSNGTLRPTMYASTLNAIAQVNAIPNDSTVLLSTSEAAPGSAAQIEERKVGLGITWLGYTAGHFVAWPAFEATSQSLNVFPEYSLYPTAPIQTMTAAGATSIQVASGVYRREFRTCYNAGVAIGPCAAIVNSTGGNVVVKSTWLHQTYLHSLAMTGGDIPSGGKIALTSTAFRVNSTYVGPAQAILLVR